MSVTDAEYAMLSNAVYHDKNFIPPENYGFTYIRGEGDEKTGFYGEVYQRDKDIVIVFRGSANPLNKKHDLQWGINGTPPPELGSAMDFYNRVLEKLGDRGLSISMTGHSLGGSEVQYINARLFLDGRSQVPGVTFAPAGVGRLFPQIPENSITVKNYIRKGDLVPRIMDEQLGYETILLPFKNESYQVQYKNGIGEIVGTRGDAGLVEQHAILGFWVDIGNLKTITTDKWLYLRDQYSSGEGSQTSFSSNFLLNQSGTNGLRTLDSHYLQLPDKQLQDMKNIAYLGKQSHGIETSDNIIFKIGNSTEIASTINKKEAFLWHKKIRV